MWRKAVAAFVDDFRVISKLPGGVERLDVLYESFRATAARGQTEKLSPEDFRRHLEDLGYRVQYATGDAVLVHGLRLRPGRARHP